LVDAARGRVNEALGAWLDGDYDRAAASAPTAVELLGKAALWQVNPTLLTPLDGNQEAVLVALATEPRLDSAALRTIGLKAVLARLVRVRGDLPLSMERRTRLIDYRNGALHAGTLPSSGAQRAELIARQVLADSLTLCEDLLRDLDLVSEVFYGDRAEVVQDLLAHKRSDIEHEVRRRLAQAREQVERHRVGLDDDEIWSRTAGELEANAAHAIAPEEFGFEMGGIDYECPACGYDARLLGRIDVESDVDFEHGRDGPEIYGFWRVRFYPRAFGCNVCKLRLISTEELEAAGVPAHEREVKEDDLGDDFRAWEWAEMLYGVRD